MKTKISIFSLATLAIPALAQGAGYDLMCRNQAKEIAMQTYSTCVTTARNSQIEEIRKNYQKELTDIKNKYEQELKKMGAPISGGEPVVTKANKKTPKATAKTSPNKPTSTPVKGIAKQLPDKAPSNSEALSIQTVPEGTKVVSVESETPLNTFEAESIEAEKFEFIELPAE